jgi:hypothetical protein
MRLHARDVEATQQPMELFFGQLYHSVIELAGPGELRLLQTLVPQMSSDT